MNESVPGGEGCWLWHGWLVEPNFCADKLTAMTLALQLHFRVSSESMGDHDSDDDEWRRFCRGDTGVMGLFAAWDQGMDPSLAHQQHAEKNEISNTKELIRWSVQEIRRLAFKLAQRQIKPARILAWSVFRRAHQAAVSRSHLQSKMQL